MKIKNSLVVIALGGSISHQVAGYQDEVYYPDNSQPVDMVLSLGYLAPPALYADIFSGDMLEEGKVLREQLRLNFSGILQTVVCLKESDELNEVDIKGSLDELLETAMAKGHRHFLITVGKNRQLNVLDCLVTGDWRQDGSLSKDLPAATTDESGVGSVIVNLGQGAMDGARIALVSTNEPVFPVIEGGPSREALSNLTAAVKFLASSQKEQVAAFFTPNAD